MEKEELLERLQKAKYWEEDFLVKYDDEHIWALLETLPKNKFERIRPLLNENLSDTRKHNQMLKELIEDIRSGKHGI